MNSDVVSEVWVNTITMHDDDKKVLASMSDKLAALKFRVFEHQHPTQWVCTWQKGTSTIRSMPGGSEIGESVAGDVVKELERRTGWIRHEKGWSMIVSETGDVMWQNIATCPSKVQWVCVKQGPPSIVYARPRGVRSGQNSAGDVVTALEQRAGWIRSNAGWSMITLGGTAQWLKLASPVTQQWACVWKKGASYIRDTPGGTKVGEVNAGDVVFELQRKDNWVRHSRGWSLISQGAHVMWMPLNDTKLPWHQRGAMSKLFDIIDVDGSGGIDLDEMLSFITLLRAASSCPREKTAADYMTKALAELSKSLGSVRTCRKQEFVNFEPSDYPVESWKVMAVVIETMYANPEQCTALLASIGSS